MDCRVAGIFIAASLFLTGCSQSPIDAKKTGAPRSGTNITKNASTQLTDKDIFGNETTLAVAEEDIQAALEGEKFRVPLNSAITLVQSGSRAPESSMQQELSKYFTVSTFSGIPDRQSKISCSKDENGDTIASENMNWMQALRYIAAKGHQKAIIVYQDSLQTGKYDELTKTMIWSDHKNEKVSGAVSLRYLVRFILVDVASGSWAAWSPVNSEYELLPPQGGKSDVTEQQIIQLKQKTYAAMVKDLVTRYQ